MISEMTYAKAFNQILVNVFRLPTIDEKIIHDYYELKSDELMRIFESENVTKQLVKWINSHDMLFSVEKIISKSVERGSLKIIDKMGY